MTDWLIEIHSQAAMPLLPTVVTTTKTSDQSSLSARFSLNTSVIVSRPVVSSCWTHAANVSGDSSLIILYSISISPSKSLNLQQQQSEITYSKPRPMPHAPATPASSSYIPSASHRQRLWTFNNNKVMSHTANLTLRPTLWRLQPHHLIAYSISISLSKSLNLQKQQSDVTYSKPHPTPHALATPASSSYSLLHQHLTVKVFEPSKTTKWCHIQQTLPHAPATPASSSYSLLHQHLTVKVSEPSTTTKWRHIQQTSPHAPATPASSSYSLLHQHLTVKVLEPSTTTKWHHTQQTSTHAPLHGTGKCDSIITITRGQSNLTKSASREAHSPVRGHPRGSKFVPLNSWGRGSY